jgi:hypothetical protein
MTAPDQLPLRDIHLPPEPGWWPPAPGWWILALLPLAAAAGIVLWRRRVRRLRRAAVTVARNELEMLRTGAGSRDAREVIRDLSALMRRLAVSLYPRRDVASLTGAEWLHFLDGPLPERPFSTGPGRILVEAPYRPSVDPAVIAPLLDVCAGWIHAAGQAAGKSKSERVNE